MVSVLKRTIIFSAIIILLVVFAIPHTFAFADEYTQLPQDESDMNSWRYTDGVLTTLGEGSSELSLQSDESGSSELSLQAQSSIILRPVGIDVSYAQGAIDWARVAKTNIDYVIIRCGYGNDDKKQDDTQWLNNVNGCRSNGIPFGVYIYSYAYNVQMAKSEGQHVVRCLKEAGLGPNDVRFPIYLDLEQSAPLKSDPNSDYSKLTPDDYNAMWLAFKQELNNAGYTKVGVYANATWWRDKLNKISLSSDYIWYARYGLNDPNKPLKSTDDPFEGFSGLSSRGLGLWQYSSVGKLDGITGNVDMNYCRIDLPFYYSRADTDVMYRLYNKYTGEHLYTRDGVECASLSKIGWTYEGIAWIAPKKANVPVYRLYNRYSGDHHYTTDKNEYDYLCKIGWTGEGVAWYSDDKKGTALHRLFNPYETVGTHHYTKDVNERDNLVKLGWRSEGVGWYGI